MNVFSIIIHTALVFEFALQMIGNLLNLKALKLEPPPALKGIYKIGPGVIAPASDTRKALNIRGSIYNFNPTGGDKRTYVLHPPFVKEVLWFCIRQLPYSIWGGIYNPKAGWQGWVLHRVESNVLFFWLGRL